MVGWRGGPAWWWWHGGRWLCARAPVGGGRVSGGTCGRWRWVGGGWVRWAGRWVGGEVDLVDADRRRQVDLGVAQVELEVLAVLRQARVVRARAVRSDLSRGHPRVRRVAGAGDFATTAEADEVRGDRSRLCRGLHSLDAFTSAVSAHLAWRAPTFCHQRWRRRAICPSSRPARPPLPRCSSSPIVGSGRSLASRATSPTTSR